MPRSFDMWQVVTGCYVFGLISFIYARVKQFTSRDWDFIFCLSILGFGLFIYYEGESSYRNLINVSWPAIILMFLFSDRGLRLVRTKCLPKISVIFALPVLAFGIFTSGTYILGIPTLLNFGAQHWNRTLHQIETPLTQALHFMKEQLGEEKQAGIWLNNQSAYFAELGIASAIQGPGLIELVLKSDAQGMLMQIANGIPKVLFLGLSNNQIPPDLQQVLRYYSIVAVNDSIACLKRVNFE